MNKGLGTGRDETMIDKEDVKVATKSSITASVDFSVVAEVAKRRTSSSNFDEARAKKKIGWCDILSNKTILSMH